MKHLLILLTLTLLSIYPSWAQQVIEIQPLFEYPTAPEDMESLEDRCDYVVAHFWDNFDMKSKKPVDQYALNEAFLVYCSTFPYASKKVVDQSVDNLIQKISGNPLVQMQMVKAAETNLYGPKAQYWIDELYLRFIDSIIKNKKIPEARKTKYISQASSLRGSAIGNTAPSFNFTDKQGEVKKYFPMSTPTLLIVGNPEDTDWRLLRLRMDSNFQLDDALAKGKVNVLYIIPTATDNWQTSVSNYNAHWTIGQSEDVTKHYDIRIDPSVYLIGSDGKIIEKNTALEPAVSKLLEMVK